ncbi:hypothetical protein EDD11_001894 [Mortierella claussenii]|nr:hypothetical protein EDD11_001894 [Mortierella claussenii]
MGFTFDIELNTAQPFIVELDTDSTTQLLSGAIVIQLSQPEKLKVATVAIHGHVGVALNIDTKPTIVHERLVGSTVDLVAANDTEGHGTIRIPESGTHRLPFRIDLPRPDILPPTLINKLDTHYIDWKYEIHTTLHRDSLFSSSQLVKHDLILRRPIVGKDETVALLTASTDLPKQFRSKLSVPSRIALNDNRLIATVEMKARDKSYMVKEIDCAVVQTENINYITKRSHPNVANAINPGVPCTVNASRLVSSIRKIANDDFDLDFGRKKPIELDIRLDNFQLIPTERGLEWLEIFHVVRFTVHFMDINLKPIITELPLFVDHERSEGAVVVAPVAEVKAQETHRLVDSLRLGGLEKFVHHLHADKETTSEAA